MKDIPVEAYEPKPEVEGNTDYIEGIEGLEPGDNVEFHGRGHVIHRGMHGEGKKGKHSVRVQVHKMSIAKSKSSETKKKGFPMGAFDK
jgi:hypothetical protein